MTSIRMGLALLALLSLSVGCTGRLAASRNATSVSLSDQLVYRHYKAQHLTDHGEWSGGGLPTAITLDRDGNAWVLGEFHTKLQYVSASDVALATKQIWIPHQPDAAPFVDQYGKPSQNSMLGESVAIDAAAGVWLSQGGGGLKHQGENHSRVIFYDPRSGDFKAYNLPGNRNEAVGLHWDDRRGLIWVAESGMYGTSAEGSDELPDETPRAGSILAFDPDNAPHDNDFRWDRSLDQLLCPETTPKRADCFLRYPLPDGAFFPAHLLTDASGAVWFTLFWACAIGRLDPETGDVIIYPLAPGIGTNVHTNVVGPGPWDIAISPDGEHLVWSEFFDNTLARLPLARALEPECRALRDGRNPCVEERVVPGADLGRQGVHSIAFDRFGNLWFTQQTFPVTPEVTNSIGFVTADWSRVELVDLAEVRPDRDASYAGIAVSHDTGDIWVAQFLPPGVARLTPIDRDLDPASHRLIVQPMYEEGGSSTRPK